MLHKQLREVNRLSWNEAIRIRNRYKGEEAVFFREGGNALDPEERALLGDLSGLSVVHLQCNCGEDTLSLAQVGATVTGVGYLQRLPVSLQPFIGWMSTIGLSKLLKQQRALMVCFVRTDQ